MTKSAVRPAKIVFRDPMGEWHEDPDASWIKQAVTNQDPQFWETGSGEAAIDFYEGENRTAILYITSRSNYGFVLDYDRVGSNERYFVLRNGDHTGETVEAVIGGDPVLYWREHFVPPDIAWQAVETFLRTGERDHTLTWEIHDAPDID